MRKAILKTIRSLSLQIIYANASSACESTEEEGYDDFIDLITTAYKLRDLSEEDITPELLDYTIILFDHCIVDSVCDPLDSTSKSSSYTDLVAEQKKMLIDQESTDATDECAAAYVDALQSRVKSLKCKLGCID